MYETLERERQVVAQALRHAELQQESADRDRQVAHSTVHKAMTELHHARDEAHMWQQNTRVQYQKLEKVSEAHQDLYQRQRVLERENASLRLLSEQQHADLQGLWRREEHVADITRSFSPQQRDIARLVQSLKVN